MIEEKGNIWHLVDILTERLLMNCHMLLFNSTRSIGVWGCLHVFNTEILMLYYSIYLKGEVQTNLVHSANL